MSTIQFWSKPSCVQCTATERKLRQLGADFEKLDLLADPDKLDEFKSLGHLTAPVLVFPDGEVVSGFQPDVIDRQVKAAA